MTDLTQPTIIRVDVTPADAIDRAAGLDGFTVDPVWDAPGGLDRPNVGGWFVKDRKLADRLAAAIEAGVVCRDATVEVDVNGARYVQADRTAVMGRRMNADLTRLGF